MSKKDTELGLDENVEGLLCYVLGWVTGLIFLVLEKENNFVRFHAGQSLVVFLGIFVVGIVIGWIPIIGWLISPLLFLLGFVLWIILMVKAYQGEKYELPYIGDFVKKQIL